MPHTRSARVDDARPSQTRSCRSPCAPAREVGRGAFAPPPENLGRLKSKLRRHPAAMAALLRMGLEGATIDALHLGLKEPYRHQGGEETRDAVCFPLLDEAMRSLGRYAYLNLDGVTANPQGPRTWGPGSSAAYWLGSPPDGAVALVADDVVECWLAWQALRGEHVGLHVVAPSHAGGWPAEWRSSEYWARFSEVVVLPGQGSTEVLRAVAERMERPVRRLSLSLGEDTLRGLREDGPSLRELVERAEPWFPDVPAPVSTVPPEALGRFEAQPVPLTGAFVDGRSYYPFAVEARRLETSASEAGRLVHAYETLVLRSDGCLLGAETLPAPRGTPADRRILALTDGTRIVDVPRIATTSTWSFPSIQRFIDWRRRGAAAPFRSLEELFGEAEACVRQRVWLPEEDGYALAASYVLVSHVHQVFDALPILLVTGGPGTGKSELGEAIARLSANAVVASQLRAAGMIRLLDETRGLLVLDDVDGTGPSSMFGCGELAQAIKTGYKRSTARKPVADRGGRVRMVDFFGCKVLTNTRGVDPVLGSRALTIRTEARPLSIRTGDRWFLERDLDDLRDELHCWGMAECGRVHDAYRSLPAPRDRRQEICAPLVAFAALVDGTLSDRLRELASKLQKS